MSENKPTGGKSLQRHNSIADWGLNIKTVNESLVNAIDLTKKGTDFAKAFEKATPWIESVGKVADYASEVFRPFKLFAKIANDLTKITDPEKLGYIACTIAFQNALKLAIQDVAPHNKPSTAINEVAEQLKEINFEDLDFSVFDLKLPMVHEFFRLAQDNAKISLMLVGYTDTQSHHVYVKVRDNFDESFRKLLTDGETADKFKPFKDYLSLGRQEQIARKNLARHVEYQIWQFESAPVLGKEPFALKDVYIESDCGKLTWGKITGENEESSERVVRNELKQPKLDAFSENNGGRYKLLDVVMKLIADEKNKQPIIIQGVAGSGKTSFTLRLCSELVKNGLIPIRIRLRDINLNWTIEEALPRAIRLSDKQYGDKEILLNNDIFKENGIGNFDKISRYVLILDGWDELSTSASESFKARVEKIIGKVLDRFVRNTNFHFPVKIVLTGRPSEQITTGELLHSQTPVLTLRSLTNEQLARFVDNIHKTAQTGMINEFREKFENFPADYFPKDVAPDFEDWQDFDKSKFDSILSRYDYRQKRLEVLGLPLLAHLTAHLIKYWKGKNATDLVENETTLYRNLINLTCEKAGKGQPDKTMSPDDARRLSTFRDSDLRKLLWATAGAMSVFGDESISHDELERRLKENEELRRLVEKISKENWLSSLLISFYFKGGVKELGCEFSHKSFREYLFAEAIVKELKEYGETAKAHYDVRENEWDNFPENDRRRELSRNLAKLLSPQWLKDEVIEFLRESIRWEIERAKDHNNDKDIGSVEPALTLEQWRRVRDGLADLWGWWNNSVHLRPEAEYKKGRYSYEKPAFINELIQNAMPFSEERELPPPSTNALDAHLGEAFCYLNVFLHDFLRDRNEENRDLRKYQSVVEDERRFRPSGDSKTADQIWFSDFYYVVGRINSTGNRPRAVFPSSMNLSAVDLSRCFMSGLIFDRAILHRARLFRANLDGASLDRALLDRTRFFDTDLHLTVGLTEEQIKSASIDRHTLLPKHLNI
jgi:hypothetical protein